MAWTDLYFLHPPDYSSKGVKGDNTEYTDIYSWRRPFFVIQVDFGTSHLRKAKYFSHLSWQPEQLKHLMGDRFAGGFNLVRRSWEVGNESFYRHPVSWHLCLLSLMCCSSHFSESLTSQTEKIICWLCGNWWVISLRNNTEYYGPDQML